MNTGAHFPPEKALPGRRNVIALGLVSMFNDMASEMAYPIIPLFLTLTLGAPPAVVGVIEGVAEATANFLKLISGWLSDRVRNRKRFVAVGYLLSAVAKVGLALSASWVHVLGARFADRFGKGVRTSARDALIAESTLPGERGSAFGLHRALDTAGAVIGPLTALALLGLFGGDFRLVFFVAAVPACVGVALLMFLVREPAHGIHPASFRFSLSPARYGRRFKMFLIASALFAVGNSSDAFLLLRAQSVGFSVNATILLYVAFNIVYSLLSFPMGRLADRFGKMPVLLGSFVLFTAVYGGLGIASGPTLVGLLFPVYGLYMAMSEGIGKAYIVDCVPSSEKASALGLFATLTGVGTLVASPLAGYLWSAIDPAAPFYLGAVCAAGAGILLFVTRR